MGVLSSSSSNSFQKTEEHYLFYSLTDVQRDVKNSFLSAIFEEYDFLKFCFFQNNLRHISFVKKSAIQTTNIPSFYKPFRQANHFIIPASIQTNNHNYKQKNLVNYQKIVQQFDSYFLGKSKNFELVYQLSGTPTFKKIWQTMSLIPYGQTETYGELAERIFGSKRYSRVVALACKRNSLGDCDSLS